MKSKMYIPCIVFTMFLCGIASHAVAQVTPKLQHDIELLMLEKSLRTPTEQKIDSRLLQAVRERSGQKMIEGIDLLPADVNADAGGTLNVDINATITEDLLSKLKALGATVIFPSAQYHTVRATVHLSMVATIAAYAEVKFIEPAVLAVGVGMKQPQQVAESTLPGSKPEIDLTNFAQQTVKLTPQRKKLTFAQRADAVRKQLKKYMDDAAKGAGFFSGLANSQGDKTHRADQVRSVYGYEGQGIKIGVLSDSYNALGVAGADVTNNELPGTTSIYGNINPVTVLADYATGSDEGRAMLQIVHDVAPQAQLFFATAFISEASFASNIIALRNTYNCDVIIDDIFYYDEPVFQDGIVAQAVNTVTAAGALYFSSAGNEGSILRNTSGYFEGDFNDAGSLVFTHPGGKTGTIHNFGTLATPVNGDIITVKGNVYTLNWSDPMAGSANDYDLFIVSSTGTVKTQSTNVQSGTQNPYEVVSAPTLVAGDRFVVFKTGTAAVRAFAINTNRGQLTVKTTGQTHGHSSAVNAFSVAATPAGTPAGATTAGPYPNPFVATNQTEYFSSDGPRRIFYTPGGTAITPGNVLFGSNGGVVLNKPDITAADGVTTTLGASSGLNPFYGTSAAAPHAGAIAALLKSANPALTPAQVRTILTSTAVDIESAGFDITSGIGIVQAFQAMQAVAPIPISNIHLGTVTASEGTGTNNNGQIDPGENGKLVVQLNDPAATAATAVSATLTTSTAGITITQGVVSYGTITGLASGTNTATPFLFAVGSGVGCGTVINFSLSVSFTNGGTATPRTFNFTAKVGSAGTIIASTMGAVPPTSTAYTVISGQQTGRLNRNSIASTCAVPKANPGLTVATGARQYDAYKFNNPAAAQCVTVSLTATVGTNLYVAAYDNNGFLPATPNTNYLADPGASPVGTATVSFSFTAPAAQFFTVVVHDVNVTPASNTPYTLNVGLATCPSAALPVTWLDFTASLQPNNQVALNWKVANELNISRYEVEYSTDGIQFSNLANKPASTSAAIEKNYSHTDPLPNDGINYYRIKQVDLDGRYTYSKIVSIKIDRPDIISVRPNPATSFVLVQSKVLIKRIQLFSSTGEKLNDILPGRNSYQLPVTALPAGQYFIRIETKDGIISKKITRQ